MKIEIAICDDNIGFIEELKKLISSYARASVHSYSFRFFTSGKSLIERIQKNYKPDLLFLDIDLKEDTLGTSYGVKAKTLAPDILLIYISAYSYYETEIIHSEPFNFLEKPICEKLLSEVLSSAEKRVCYLKQDAFFFFKANGIAYKINLREVLYFESQHRVINIHTCKGNIYRFYEKLDDLEPEIEEIYPYFLRVNKSFYVNCRHIDVFSKKHVCVRDLKINIGKKYKNIVFDKLYLL